MIRAFIKVDPETGDVVGYSEGSVQFDQNGDEIPIPDVSSQGYLQIEVEPGNWRDHFAVDLRTMAVTRTPFDTSTEINDQDDPAFLAAENARKARAMQRIDLLGKRINVSRHKLPKASADG